MFFKKKKKEEAEEVYVPKLDMIILNTIKGMADMMGAKPVDHWEEMEQAMVKEESDTVLRELSAAELESWCLLKGISDTILNNRELFSTLWWANLGVPLVAHLNDCLCSIPAQELANTKQTIIAFTGLRRVGDKLCWVERTPSVEEQALLEAYKLQRDGVPTTPGETLH